MEKGRVGELWTVVIAITFSVFGGCTFVLFGAIPNVRGCWILEIRGLEGWERCCSRGRGLRLWGSQLVLSS